MKTYELLEDTGGKLLTGGIAYWREKLGVSKEDIQKAMVLARDLDSYKKLIKYMPENTTPRQKSNGTICFDSTMKGASSFTNTYVHFYGQVRAGNDSFNRNAPLVSKEPEIFADPVKTVLNAYDNGFKTILKSINIGRMRSAPDLLLRDVYRILRENGATDVKVAKIAKKEVDYMAGNWQDRPVINRGKHGVLIVPTSVYSAFDALYSKKQKPEEFLADITDDPEQKARLLARLKDKPKQQRLAELSRTDERMEEIAGILRDQKEFNLDVRVMKMTDAKREYEINKTWPDEFTDSFKVVYARLKNDKELRRYRFPELDDNV